MPRRRPAVLVVMGILNIVFGVLGLVCGVCGVAANSILFGIGSSNSPGSAVVRDMIDFLSARLPGYQAVEIGKAGLTFILGVLLIIAGIGLLSSQGWARWMTFVYGVVMLLIQIAYPIFELGMVMPAIEEWKVSYLQRHNMAIPESPMSSSSASAGIVVGAFFFGAYAITALIVMLLPAVAEGCARNPVAAAAGEEDYEPDYDDRGDDDDYPRRRPKRGRDYEDDDD